MKLLTPACRCQHCGAPPPTRITEADRDKYAADDPERFAGTFRCSRCHRVTALKAAAFQFAA